MAKGDKVIVACMRNEALFVVEWVAHHLAMGFDRIVVFTNDCDDGTDHLLDVIGQELPVERFDNPGPYPEGSIQKQALATAFGLPQVRSASWVLHIDADEYVNVTCGRRRIDDLIRLHRGADAIALQWRHFGSAGLKNWPGGRVVEQFRACEQNLPVPGSDGVVGFKTLFRPKKFRLMGVHMPKLPYRRYLPVIVNAAGVPMPVEPTRFRQQSAYPVEADQCSWENALIHHHHVKSDDLHRLKHARGDANGRRNDKREIGSAFYQSVDRNEARSDSLVQLRRRVGRVEARIRSIAGVTQAEDAAWGWVRQRFGEIEVEPAAGLSHMASSPTPLAVQGDAWIDAMVEALSAGGSPVDVEQAALDWFKARIGMVMGQEKTSAEAAA